MKRMTWMILAPLILTGGAVMATGSEKLEKATFAGGCFWCVEAAFDGVPGVISAVSGYAGGEEEDPSYDLVSAGKTGHVEAVQVTYDPARISYDALLDIFWRQIDPTDAGGQFADRGKQYGTAIFYHDDHQRQRAEASRLHWRDSSLFGGEIATRLVPYTSFWPAEDYHQDYSKKNPTHYQLYKRGSGRSGYIERVWKEVPPRKSQASCDSGGEEKDLRQRLSPLQFQVTQQNGTERPFANAYWDQHEPGIYVDVVSGEPLFSSTDKFDSGSGWPSFTRPLQGAQVIEKKDVSLGMSRTEVRSGKADSHLGHLFDDGPAPTGQRYCINSASLRFIPKDDLEREGYGQYQKLFE